MTYGSTTAFTHSGPDDWKTKMVKSALFFVPAANPDHEPLYPKVRKWLVEVDENGNACREVGLDAEGRPLLAAPNQRNAGFWTDSSKIFAAGELVPMEAAEFERAFQDATTRGTHHAAE